MLFFQDDEDEEEVAIKPVARAGGKSLIPPGAVRGKQLRRPEPEEDEPVVTTIRPASGGRGKQLRPPPPTQEEEEPSVTIRPAAGRGKQLRPPPPPAAAPEEESSRITGAPKEKEADDKMDVDSDKDEEEMEEAPVPRGKQLRPPATKITRSPAGGKQLRQPAKKAPAKKTPTVTRSPAGGKQLRQPQKKDSDDDDDDDDDFGEDSSEEEELFDDDKEEEEEEDDDYEEVPAKKPSRPRRAAAAKKKAVVEEDFGDDDISSDEEMELDENNTDALIKDEEDRKYLESLPELEREAILADRFEKAKAEQDMKKVLREAKRKEDEKAGKKVGSKRKVASAKQAPAKKKSRMDEDEELARKLAGASKRESQRDKDATGAKSKKAAALANLRKEMKKKKQKEEEDDDGESDDFLDSDDSDEEYDDGGFMPWQKEKKKTVSKPDREESDDDSVTKPKRKSRPSEQEEVVKEADLADFVKVTIPRRRLARWCNEPFFAGAVLECFVRVTVGEDDKGEMCYRLCEIVDVVDGDKAYKFPKEGDQKIVSTNKLLRLRFGNSEKNFPMYLVSNSPPDEVDVQKYVSTMRNLRQSVLSKRYAAKLRRLQDNLVNNYTYKTEDIDKLVEMQRKQGKGKGNLGLEQTKAQIAVQAARDSLTEAEQRLMEAKKKLMEAGEDSFQIGDLETAVDEAEKVVEDCKKNLKEKEDELERTKELVVDRKRRMQKTSKIHNWAKVNKRAVQMNQKTDREANKEREQKEADQKGDFNPYARRKVKPKVLWEVGQEKEEGGEEKKDQTSAENEPARDTGTTEVGAVIAPPLVQEDEDQTAALTESHQFTIDEEALAKDSLSFLPSRSQKPVIQRVRKGLSLTEYLERKAAGTL